MAKWPNVLNTTGFYCFWWASLSRHSVYLLPLLLSRAHEFEKHGTCSGLTEYNFFKKVLGIFDDLPSIGNAFNNAGVVPSNQHTHDVSCLVWGHYGTVAWVQLMGGWDWSIGVAIFWCIADNMYHPFRGASCLTFSLRHLECHLYWDVPPSRYVCVFICSLQHIAYFLD